MNVFGTEMHLVTGLLVIIEIFLVGAQLVNWLYVPRVRRELLYLWLLVLMILYNVFGGFFPDASIPWISLKLQNMLAWGSGFAVAAYIPYYFYAAFGLTQLKFFAFKGMLFFLALPYIVFFVVQYHFLEDLDFSIHWGLIVPAIYGLAFFWCAYRAIAERYKQDLETERLEMFLIYLAVLPWMCMIPFGYFHVSQLTEVLTTNTGLLIISGVVIARSVREKWEEREYLLQIKEQYDRNPNEALFEENLNSSDFSPREIEIIRLLRLGLTKEDIADKLFIARTTVSRHVQNIYSKVEVSNIFQLMRKLERKK
jgi:DNA-binding CsgD family transcriptional regulator/TRAP-type C4-dicarboxylate transport system permease small subunit